MKLRILAALICLTAGVRANTLVTDSFAQTGAGSSPTTLLSLKTATWGSTALGGPGYLFNLLSDGEILVVHTFGDIGVEPNGGLVQVDGNLYGVLVRGISYPDSVIFRTTVDDGVKVVHQFYGDENGGSIAGDMSVGEDGRLYTVGTTGGAYNGGVVISVDPLLGDVEVLHSFQAASDGSRPQCPPIENADAWYGIASYDGPNGGGTFYRIKDGEFSVKFSFPAGSNPSYMMLASDGNFYVEVSKAESSEIYQIIPEWTEIAAQATIIHSFDDGGLPYYGLLEANDGYLYGVEFNTLNGKANGGFFRIDFAGTYYTYIHSFVGEEPSGASSMGLDGKLYAPLQNGDIAQIQLDAGHSANISTRMMVVLGKTSQSAVSSLRGNNLRR